MSGGGFAAGNLVDRTFSMGRVVSLTFSILGRNAVAIGGVALAVAVLGVVLNLLLGLAVGVSFVTFAPNGAPGFNVTAFVIAAVLGAVVGAIVQSVGTGGITQIAVSDLNGVPVGVGPAFATGLRLALPLLGLGLIVGFGIALGCLLLLVPGLMLAMMWFVATPVRVVEGPTVGAALTRSRALTAGYRWPLFGLALALGVLSLALNWLVGQVGLRGATGANAATVVHLVLSAVLTALGSTGIAVCYAELRRVKEGATPSQLAAVFA